MAQIITVMKELRQADTNRRNRDRMGGGLRALTAYMTGFTIIRMGANTYVYFSSLRNLSSRGDVYGLVVMLTAISCVPLVTGLILSPDRTDTRRRFSMLPITRNTRFAISAVEPAVSALPILLLASLLPAVSALPIIAFSVLDYLKLVSWYVLTCATFSLGIRSLLGILAKLAGSSRRKNAGHSRRIMLATVLAVLAAANPRPVFVDGRLAMALSGSTTIQPEAFHVASLPLDNFITAVLLLALALLFAAVCAIAEDAATGRRGLIPGFWRASDQPGARWLRPHWLPSHLRVRLPAMLPVVEAERRVYPDLIAACALAATSVIQKPDPSLPLWFAAALLLVRFGSAVGHVATDNPATKRFTFIPAKPGTASRAFLTTAGTVAILISLPLCLASFALALG